MADSKDRESNSYSDLKPEIIRGRVARLMIYEVEETELEILTQGSSSSIYLNFAIFLLSLSVAFIIALLTTTIASNRIFTVFVVIAVVGAMGGSFLLLLWLKTRKSISDLVRTIRNRVPPKGIQEQN